VAPQDPTRNVLERVVALEQRGEVQRAIQLLEAGIARVEKPAPLYNRLALILVDQQRDYRRAEALLQKAVNLEPGNTVYQQNLFRVISLAASAEM
jgi:tetratricopeptide (TPR) repeat protein